MAKKINSKKVKQSVKSGLNFSKFYFSKSTSIILITTYSVVLFLALAVLGFSNLILPKSTSSEVPSLPEKEPFAFLPADNIEVPSLGDTESETAPEKQPAKEEKTSEESTISAPEAVTTPAIAETSVTVVEKEVVKEVVKEVPKEVVKVVEKEVAKETPKEIPKEPEQTYYDNYTAPDLTPIGEFIEYENFPDEDFPENTNE